MARIPQTRCLPCKNKRVYRSEQDARAALGSVLNGSWKGATSNGFALVVYRCPERPSTFHIGHNPKAVDAFPQLCHREKM